MGNSKKTLITIVGPTAIGKTSLSILIASYFDTEIISCDSRQFYKEMTLGTAVPEKEELAAVPHHFIQNKSIFEDYNVGAFERDALNVLDTLFKKHNTVVMVGGSGLYVKAVLEGLDDFPKIDSSIRLGLKHILETELTKVANKVLFTTLLEVAKNKKVPIAQDDAAASYCKKITKSSGKVNFIDEDASSVIRKFNAFKDWPGIFFEKNNVVIKIHGIRVLSEILHSNESKEFYFCADGLAVKTSSSTLVITHLQFPGKNIIASQDAANSYAKFFAD